MSKVNVFITVDTEHSIGGAFKDPDLKPVGNEKRVYGKFGDKYFGIPLIMDIAKRYNIPLTFFVEVFNKYYFGESETEEVCHYILKRGHDVQLHLHPNFMNFTLSNPQEKRFPGNMCRYDFKTQSDFVYEGKELLAYYTGKSPIAFRAGNFGADINTIKALKLNGILVDSSYNYCYFKKSKRIFPSFINDVMIIEGIFEFPVTNFRERVSFSNNQPKPLDINGVSFHEMKSVLDNANIYGPRNITIIMHSFSFLKPYDAQYIKVRPRFYVIKRFENLCSYLHKNADIFDVKTFSDLNLENLEQIVKNSVSHFPKVPAFATIKRHFEQIKDYIS